ncbi:MAG: chemotaxis protein CheA [Candidatus Kapaibacterium sp.]
MINFEDSEMQEILSSYLVETGELLEKLSVNLIELENNPEDTELTNKIFRYFHTIKGTSSFMGFDNISELTHSAEDLLNKIRHNEIGVSRNIIDVLMDTRDRVESMMISINDTEEIKFDDLVSRIDEVSGAESEIRHKNTSKLNDTENFTVSAIDKVINSEDMFHGSGDFNDDELALIDAAFSEVAKSLNQVTPENSKNDITNDEHINNKDKNIEYKLQSQLNNINKDTLRIDVKRVEALMDLSGELVLGRNRLTQITERFANGKDIKQLTNDLIEATNQIDRITSEIQASIMKMRMVPIGRLFQKAPKIVRDIAKEFNKNIRLVLEGEDTEVDRGIIEELNDPLVHMIRNSCDHGIETEEDRIKAGKNPKGTIRLTAYQEGNHITVKIIDDGKGIDPELIKRKAVEKGFISDEYSFNLSDREIYQLIFTPGFSTAGNVTSVSGRGVGMDVVKTNINKLKGIIEIDSVKGSGSEFIIKLPLTLAIIQGLLVQSSENIYALPLNSVVEVVSYDTADVHSVNNRLVARIRNQILPLIDLNEITNDKRNDNNKSKYVVNLAVGIDRIGLIVDELLGQQEIVIKPLGDYLTDVEGIAGSTIIGDGRVIMILDTQDIIKKYKEQSDLKYHER